MCFCALNHCTIHGVGCIVMGSVSVNETNLIVELISDFFTYMI